MNIFKNLCTLFYPNTCLSCESHLMQNEFLLCTHCRHNLPITGFCETPNNAVEKVFRGRVPIEEGTALLFFRKKGISQILIHQLKYKGRQEVGDFFGIWMGEEFKNGQRFKNLDGIVKVPLHKKRFKERGYNQLTYFANRLSRELQIPVINDVLVKVGQSTSQTKKNRFNRFEKISERFQLSNGDEIRGKHVLLIDDVLTTGATLEACANELLKVPDVRISIATMVISDHY